MDRQARDELIHTAMAQRDYARHLRKRLFSAAPYIRARNSEVWDVLLIITTFEFALDRAIAAARSGLPWSGSLCSALVDEAYFSRGLLHHAGELAVALGLLSTAEDAQRITENVIGSDKKRRIIVAYMDYVGVTNRSRSVLETFARLGWTIAKHARAKGFVSYYWRSSDTFYIFRCTDTDTSRTDHDALIELLLLIQENVFMDEDKNHKWMWSIGVDSGDNRAIGDIFIPGESGGRAAQLMKVAYDKLQGGGAILLTREYHQRITNKVRSAFKPVQRNPKNGYFYERRRQDNA